MTHRSPLVTLLGLVAAFAIMFGVNLASSAPRDSYTAGPSPTASATAAASTADPTSAPPSTEPSPSPPPTPSPSPTETAEEKFPNKVVYAGRTEDDSAALAVAILGDRAAAYLCDGQDVESWLRGTVKGNEISLTSKKGAALEAKLVHGALEGKIELAGRQELQFLLNEAKPPAGLYRARGAKTTIGWIILRNGEQVGIQTTGEESAPAPKLDPDSPEVTVDGEQLQGEPVSGDLDV